MRERLAYDRRLVHLDLDVKVDGGVVHVDGEVADAAEARLLRRTLGRINGVLAVWDVVRIAGEPQPRVVDVGCGGTKQRPDAIGVDFAIVPCVDVVADLEHRLPLPDASVDYIFAVHVLEHVHDLFGLMTELHRVLKPTGVLHAMVPDWRHPNAVADPTHVRFFGALTFRDFCRPGRPWSFEPVAVSTSEDSVFADLEPIDGQPRTPTEEVLARFFT